MFIIGNYICNVGSKINKMKLKIKWIIHLFIDLWVLDNYDNRIIKVEKNIDFNSYFKYLNMYFLFKSVYVCILLNSMSLLFFPILI